MPGIMPGPMFDPLVFVPEFVYAAVIVATNEPSTRSCVCAA